MVPNFIVIGAQRSGTTSLYAYLRRHPDVVPARMKEVHYFDLHYHRGVDWYLDQFPDQGVTRHGRTGEASPYYIFHPHAPRRAFDLVPDAKLIALLRDPVDRAISHYHHEVTKGYESASLEEAIEHEPGRIDGEIARMEDDQLYTSFNHRHFSYLARGVYVDQLQRWLAVYPRSQVLVVRSEDLFSEPRRTMELIFDFLDLSRLAQEEYPVLNARTYPAAAAGARARLEEYFDPHNRRLYAYLDRDFGWSRSPAAT